MIGVITSCQRPELLEQDSSQTSEGSVSGKACITMSAVFPDFGQMTKAMGKTPDIHSFHLVVFDENGMFVELAEAEFIGDPYKTEDVEDSENTDPNIPVRPNMDSDYIRQFRVVLTLTDEPRIIHFIANCPVDQIAYGHEASIISNLHVDNGETAYWSRAEVPHIKVEEESYTLDGQVHRHPCEHLKKHLEYVHLLRNFAQIVVEAETEDDSFELEGFSIYNTIDKGTVAPYNNKNQEDPFQCFVDWDHDKDGNILGTGHTHTYEQFMAMEYPYEGHALSSAVLNQELPKEDGKIKWFTKDDPFFMYERKVSVKTDEEDKWRESPPHIIVKSKYNGAPSYYKFDLVYNVMDKNDPTIISEIKYYNILRNFLYKFTITGVSGPGYDSPEEAIAGTTSNNLAGSTTASKFTEVSVGTGAIAVSYTDTTVVNSGVIHLKYKYERENEVQNSDLHVTLLNASNGDVISTFEVADTDIQSGIWKDYRDVALTIKEPGNTVQEQIVVVKTEDAKLLRNVRFILRKKMQMLVECEPKIASGIAIPHTVKIKLPPGMTEDMFPLELDMEVKGLTLSPDATKSDNHLPVTSGPSIIEGKNANSFYFTKTILTYSEYMNTLEKDANNYRIIDTYWITNAINNASTIYVANKYFEQANASWTNVKYAFSGEAVNTQNIPMGLDRDVAIQFTMDSSDGSYSSREVTLKLNGMRNPTAAENDDETVMRFSLNNRPSNVSLSGRTVTVTGLKTTDLEGKISFTVDNSEYQVGRASSSERTRNTFTGSFNKTTVSAAAGEPVNYTLSVPTYYQGMVINVTLDGLRTQSSETKLVETESLGAIRKYTFTPSATGTFTFALQTVNKEASICSITVETDDKYYYSPISSTLNQAMREFTSLSISNVRQGIGRPVTISFGMATDDNAWNSKNIRVTLVGMTRNGTETSFTVNTGSNDVNRDNNYRTITLKNITTSTSSGDLTVTISADDYQSRTANVTNRIRSQFSNVTLNPEALGANAGEVVTLSFSSDGLYDGMPVTLDLDGLEPVNGSVATRAASSYIYTVSGTDTQTVQLRTTESTTSSKTCTVQLKADGFEDSAVKTIEQSTVKNFNARFEGSPEYIHQQTIVQLKFDVPVSGLKVKVTLNKLAPNGNADNNNQLKKSGNAYEYTVNNAGTQIINLKPTENQSGICTVTLEATGFTTQEVKVNQKRLSQIGNKLEFQNNDHGFNAWGNQSQKGNSNGEYRVTTSSASNDKDATQIAFDPSGGFTNGKTYIIQYDIRTSNNVNGKVYPYIQYAQNNNYRPCGDFILNGQNYVEVSSTKQTVVMEAQCTETANRLIFAIGTIHGTVYLDNFSLYVVE